MSTAAKVTLTPPPGGAKITIRDGKLTVPDNPIIPFIEGDGTGPDIWRASVRVLDAAARSMRTGTPVCLDAKPVSVPDSSAPFVHESAYVDSPVELA